MTPKPIKLSEADIARFWSKVDKCSPDDCWEWTAGRNRDGYGIFHDCIYATYLAHRVVFVVTNGDTELQVCHICNNPSCCNPVHLYAGTQGDNIRQCIDENRGNRACGENSGRAKLTESNVREIRMLYADGWLQCEIVKEYGLSKSQVSKICTGKHWSHV